MTSQKSSGKLEGKSLIFASVNYDLVGRRGAIVIVGFSTVVGMRSALSLLEGSVLRMRKAKSMKRRRMISHF
jgi:hypothetical protein